MATPDEIPTDLTLEIGTDVSPEEFLALTRAFFGYVKEVAESITPAGERIGWTVQVKEGSNLIAITPTPSSSREVVNRVYAKSTNGVRILEQGDIEHAELPDGALRYLRTLSDMTVTTGQRKREIRLWVEKKPIPLDDSIGRTISEDWRTAYSDFGAIEGRLDTIQDRGALTFQVRDPVFRQTVKCFFPEAMLNEAMNNFRNRVEVSGIVHHRKNGTPISIDVQQLERLPDDSELPTARDVKGILSVA